VTVNAIKPIMSVPDWQAMLFPCKFCISGAIKNATRVKKRKRMEMSMNTG